MQVLAVQCAAAGCWWVLRGMGISILAERDNEASSRRLCVLLKQL